MSTVPFATAGIFDHEGQWLWNDALRKSLNFLLLNLFADDNEERSIRRVNFQAEALQKIASSAVGAQHCIRFERIAQGRPARCFLSSDVLTLTFWLQELIMRYSFLNLTMDVRS